MDKSKFGVGLMMTVENINPKYYTEDLELVEEEITNRKEESRKGDGKMNEEKLKRILKNFEEMGDKFEKIDEQIDMSLKVSWETLRKVVDI